MTTVYDSRSSERIIQTTRTHLGRLCIVRSGGLVGVVIAVIVVWVTFKVILPFSAIAVVILAIALITVLTWLRLHQPWQVTDQELFFQLSLDVLGLGALIYLSGGSTNPFVSLLLFPLIFAVTLLSPLYSWLMAVLTVFCYSLLLYWYVPLASEIHHMSGAITEEHLVPNFRLHIIGMWVNFVVSAGLIATVAVRMKESIRLRDRLLAVAREETLRNERIIALGTMAAGTAHELGTPLSTIAVVCNELRQDPLYNNGVLSEQLQIIRSQVDHCKQILSALLASTDKSRPLQGRTLPLDQHLQRIMAKWLLVRPNINVVMAPMCESNPIAPIVTVDQTLDQALMNLFNNAADASPDAMEIKLEWTEQVATITILDRGPGLSEEALRHAGKAFFTTKSPSHGIGIGLYLANATIERFGGDVSWFNREDGGAITQVTLPLNQFQVSSK